MKNRTNKILNKKGKSMNDFNNLGDMGNPTNPSSPFNPINIYDNKNSFDAINIGNGHSEYIGTGILATILRIK